MGRFIDALKILVAGIIVLGGIAVVVRIADVMSDRKNMRDVDERLAAIQRQPIPQPVIPQPVTVTVLSTAETIEARNVQWHPIIIEPAWGLTKLTGIFSASGGRNDIDVALVDALNLENIKAETAFRNYYYVNDMHTDSFEVSLTAGTYYLVFDNRQSAFTNKAYKVTIEATYTP